MEAEVGEARERLAQVRATIAAAATRAGRDPDAVALIAVSKRQAMADVRTLAAAGQRAFGENYGQDLRDRAQALAGLDLRWHAIGPLQRNKVKYVARFACAFHAAADEAIVRALGEKRIDDPIPCYLEVNIAAEPTKHGIAPRAVPEVADRLRQVPGIALAGLMCMPPLDPSAPPDAARPHFQRLAALARAEGLEGLSMGTSRDYEVAVEEGATVVRVGRGLFGGRP